MDTEICTGIDKEMLFNILLQFDETAPEAFLNYIPEHILAIDAYDFELCEKTVTPGHCQITISSPTIQELDGVVGWLESIDKLLSSVWESYPDKVGSTPTIRNISIGTVSSTAHIPEIPQNISADVAPQIP
jgi:hypothetical protein